MDRHQLKTLAAAIPGLVLSGRQRALLAEMRSFDRAIAARMQGPLPEVMAGVTPETVVEAPDEALERRIRRLSDVAMLMNRESELGICLRRSLIRYHFLRQIGIQVSMNFGARIVDGKPDRSVTGHAWLTLNGKPYHEAGENWRGFTVMYSFPQQSN